MPQKPPTAAEWNAVLLDRATMREALKAVPVLRPDSSASEAEKIGLQVLIQTNPDVGVYFADIAKWHEKFGHLLKS